MKHPTWYRQGLAHLARVTEPSTEHPADQALALAAMLPDLAEMRLRVERALGAAMLELDDHRGRAMPDEPMPERREMRLRLGLNRTDLERLCWLPRAGEDVFAEALAIVREAKPGRVYSVRMLQKLLMRAA